MGRLDNKIAVVTGGALGMGAAHVRAMVDEGARVVIADILEAEGSALAAELGGAARFFRLDVTNPDVWAALVADTESVWGPITVLVNNAGIAGPFLPAAELSIADYRRTIEVDLNGTFYGMHAVIPGMVAAGGGSIINISSTAGFHGKTPNVAYSAAKFGVRGLAHAAAKDYATSGVRVNSVAPGIVSTPLMESTWDADAQAQERLRVPMDRFADPRELSAAIVFLASDEASYITGTELLVDGGLTA
ncbi:SDR family NAD(P)-dependent oxidoreductase [Rhodococcus globerulus]|uniref:Glucose 1-dehydrogenase n=1 Tax=Rhodococcus globerulus TaxID=33008 RepID=A0ABU4C5D5_RHOGO|nr:glucose 1-dehydrogenase [Rhodococcus globerulus]MDV6271726.1 glucose 1-dehydrogenase [Rhodococcus globerulus]